MKFFRLVTLASFLFSTATFAAELPFGWYLEGNIGNSSSSASSGGSSTKNGVGYNINAGYKFIPYFAGEIGLTKYGNQNSSLAGSTTHLVGIDVAWKAIFPLGAMGVDLFSKIGVDRVYARANKSKFNTGTNMGGGLYLGLGASWAANPRIPINIQWARAKANSSTGTLDLISVGIAYIFD